MSRQDEQLVRLAELERAQRYKAVFGDDEGKWVYEDLKSRYGDKVSFDPNNSRVTDFNEGMRYVFLDIQTVRNFDTKILIHAIEQHANDEEAE